MKKYLSLFLCLLLMLVFVGCREIEENESSNSSETNVAPESETVSVEKIEDISQDVLIEEPVESDTVSSETEVLKKEKTSSIDTVTSKITSSKNETQSKVTSTETHSSVLSKQEITNNSSETENIKKANTSSKTVSSKKETVSSKESVIESAEAKDSKAIADKVIQYINQYRKENGTDTTVKLEGLTKYAECRSRQLVSNFSHDTDDERKAATELKYGRYIDPALYGMSGEPYYTSGSGEAIIKAGYAGSIDTVAESIAKLTKESFAHWSYVGDPANKFIGVGITYEGGLWYCDIAVSDINYEKQ